MTHERSIIKSLCLLLLLALSVPAAAKDSDAGPVRRLELLPEGRKADLHLQLAGPAAIHGGRHTGGACDVGADEGTPVTEAYKVPFKFTGKIAKVTVDITPMKTADKAEVDKARAVAAHKKALSD